MSEMEIIRDRLRTTIQALSVYAEAAVAGAVDELDALAADVVTAGDALEAEIGRSTGLHIPVFAYPREGDEDEIAELDPGAAGHVTVYVMEQFVVTDQSRLLAAVGGNADNQPGDTPTVRSIYALLDSISLAELVDNAALYGLRPMEGSTEVEDGTTPLNCGTRRESEGHHE